MFVGNALARGNIRLRLGGILIGVADQETQEDEALENLDGRGAHKLMAPVSNVGHSGLTWMRSIDEHIINAFFTQSSVQFHGKVQRAELGVKVTLE